ncbi:hypothetical protein LXL04_034929 [Taraxacum kok-saghyz]
MLNRNFNVVARQKEDKMYVQVGHGGESIHKRACCCHVSKRLSSHDLDLQTSGQAIIISLTYSAFQLKGVTELYKHLILMRRLSILEVKPLQLTRLVHGRLVTKHLRHGLIHFLCDDTILSSKADGTGKRTGPSRAPIQIRETAGGGISLAGVTEAEVTSQEEI